jgi:hypothetical protein
MAKKNKTQDSTYKPKVEISGPGIFSVSSAELLKSDKIQEQYRLLQDPEIKKLIIEKKAS